MAQSPFNHPVIPLHLLKVLRLDVEKIGAVRIILAPVLPLCIDLVHDSTEFQIAFVANPGRFFHLPARLGSMSLDHLELIG